MKESASKDYAIPRSPSHVFVELTTACNANCNGCDFRRSNRDRPRSFMSRDNLELLVEQILDLDLEVYLQSGEPLLYEDLGWFVQKLTETSRRRVHLTSNSQLAEKNPQWRLFKSICFSIDGRDPISSEVRGLKNQEEIAHRMILELGEERNKEARPELGVSAVIRPENHHRLYDYCRFWLDAKVDTVMLIHLQGTTPEAVRASLDMHPHLKAIPRHLKESDWNGIHLDILESELQRVRDLQDERVLLFPDITGSDLEHYYASSTSFVGPPKRCRKPWESLEVAVDGSIRLSGICIDMNMGHLREQGLLEAWHSEKLCKFRSILEEEEHIPACARCCGYFQGDLL